jgi:hypothetical protein
MRRIFKTRHRPIRLRVGLFSDLRSRSGWMQLQFVRRGRRADGLGRFPNWHMRYLGAELTIKTGVGPEQSGSQRSDVRRLDFNGLWAAGSTRASRAMSLICSV